MRFWLLLITLLTLGSSVIAQTLTPEQEDRARAIGLELRCPVCGGSSITESPSDFARSMLEEVRSQVRAGRSESEITQFFTSKYGNTVLLKPPFSGVTLLVWVLPILVVIGGSFVLVNYLRRASQAEASSVDPALLERVRAQLETKQNDLKSEARPS
jgi:cytochrome c-type biogenesis protein CcmH